MKIELINKELELKVNWKLSRNETTVKNNFCAGAVGHPELQEFALRMGCPP